ncbi:MAG: EAL domain-containing protein [Candidatus Velthaea sp.]
MVPLSRGTWEELQALRTAETIGEDFLFPMSAVKGAAEAPCLDVLSVASCYADYLNGSADNDLPFALVFVLANRQGGAYAMLRGARFARKARPAVAVPDDGLDPFLRRLVEAGRPCHSRLLRRALRVVGIDPSTFRGLLADLLDNRFARAFESAPFAMSLVSARTESLGRYLQANQAYCEIVGYSQEELRAMTVWSVVHPDDAERYVEVVHDLIAGRATAVDWELRVLSRDGAVVWMRQRRSLVCDDAGNPLYLFSYSEDVTQRKAEQAAFTEATQRLHHCFENAPIAMVMLSIDPADSGRYLEVNRAACELTGYSREQMLELRNHDIIHPDDRDDARAMQRLTDGDVDSYEAEMRIIRADGQIAWCLTKRSIVRHLDGKPFYCIAQVVDLTARKRAEERLQHLADHDLLTGLLNRRGFERALKGHLAELQRYRRRSALLLIDLDYFKYVNDTLGHAAGDELLRTISTALAQRCRSSDILARLGGDEFALILPEADATTAQDVADDLCLIIREKACVQDAPRMHVTASIGILPLDATTGMTAQEALVAVDIAMYEAKDAGRDRVRLATTTTESQASMQTQLACAERLRNALRDDAFVLYQQPIMNLAHGAIDRCEVLLRLRDGDGTVITPDAFLPVAERFGLMQQIDRWVIREAIRFVAVEHRADRNVQVSINLSGSSLTDLGVLACIEDELRRTGVDPRALVFEATETVAIRNIAQACRFAQRLADIGCAFALDDFGAGFSSFHYLKHLSFDYLKIDGEFICNLRQNPVDQQIVKAIVQMAVGLGKQTIAEFVGDAATVDLLRQYGVNFAQGYHIGKPRPLLETHTFARFT